MKGLTYIRIRCNISQSFLAQKLGVTRQAVNLWENSDAPPPAKRLKQLSEFFGLDEKYFLELDDAMTQEINSTPVYHHEEEGHSYYCFVPHAEYCRHPDLQTLLALPKDGVPKNGIGVLVYDEAGGPLISVDDKYLLARHELKELLASIDKLTETSRHPMGTHDKLMSTHRILGIFAPLADSVRKITLDDDISPAHRMFYYHMLMEVMVAIGVVYGSINPADLPQEEPVDPDGNPWPYDMHPRFIQKVTALLKEELEARKAEVPVGKPKRKKP